MTWVVVILLDLRSNEGQTAGGWGSKGGQPFTSLSRIENKKKEKRSARGYVSRLQAFTLVLGTGGQVRAEAVSCNSGHVQGALLGTSTQWLLRVESRVCLR